MSENDPLSTDTDESDETASYPERVGGGARRVGAAIGRGIGRLAWTTVAVPTKVAGGIVAGVTRVLPKGEAIWKSIFETSLKRLHKSSGGDVVGFIAGEDNKVQPTPLKWKSGGEDQAPGWYSKDGEWWAPGVAGQAWDYIGSVPVAPFAKDSPWRGSFLQNEVAEAVDLGKTDALFRDAEFNCVVEVDATGVDEAAVADGGVPQQMRLSGTELAEAGVLDDELINLSTPEDASGRRISWTKYVDLYQEAVGSEEMQMQEQRGRIAESDPEAERSMWMKILMWMALAVIAASVGPELVAALFGNTDLSGMSPIWMAPVPGVV